MERFQPEGCYAKTGKGHLSGHREDAIGDHVALGGNPCRESKEIKWLDRTGNRTRPDGTVVALAHLRDTDHDGRVRDRDSLDQLWYTQGSICRGIGEDAPLWCVQAPGAGSIADLTVRDLTGDGIPEIIAGNAALRQDGSVLWEPNTPTAILWTDIDADGRTDTIRGDGNCRVVVAAGGEVLWSDGSGCTSQGRYGKLASIPAHPDHCVDASISGIQTVQGTTTARVANAGTVALPAGLVVVRTDATGTVERQRQVLGRELLAGESLDLDMGSGEPADDRIQILPGGLREHGLWEWNTSNNTGSVGGEPRP